MKIILASTNQGKLKEIQHYFIDLPINFTTQNAFNIEPVEENGLSFVENAILKARHASLNSHLPALADDSGISVPALNGEPGIFSARYAGLHATDSENIDKLLEQTKHLEKKNRKAFFHCAIAFVQHALDPVPIITQGCWEGILLEKPIGNQGFGYDPIFYVPELGLSAAQLDPDVKNTVSHRAKALNDFLKAFKIVAPHFHHINDSA